MTDRRAIALVVGLLLLSACVVVRREEIQEEPPAAPAPPELPEVDPVPLVPGADGGPVGGLGWALLSPDVPRVVLQVAATPEGSLHDETIARLEAVLREHGGKQVERHPRDPIPPRDVYRVTDLRSLAEQHRETSSGGDAVSVLVLALEGRLEHEGVTGVAFSATAFAVFPEQVRARLPSGANEGAFEEAVAVHELGHLFGLVNLTGHGAFHEDPERPGHAQDESSVMHWAVETASIADVFGAGPPSDFTQDDRREMERIRGDRPR